MYWTSSVDSANGSRRLKKVQGKKKRDVAARESERAAGQEGTDVYEETQAPVDADSGGGDGGGDLLSSKDEDVIF